MSVYAPTPPFADRSRHPRTLLLIVGGHAALLAAVMTARMDLPEKAIRTITKVELIPVPKDPSPEPQPKQEAPSQSRIDRIPVIIPVPQPDRPQIDSLPRPMPMPDIGPIVGPEPGTDSSPRIDPVRTGPRFATPASKVRPPYPSSKLEREEEAALRLRLSIDDRGRVVAVEPVGSADPAFLAAARRHLIANWRYRPATEDGRPVASSTVITLRFEMTD